MAKSAAAPKEETSVSSNSALSAFLKTKKDVHYNFIRPENRVISSGSLILDSVVKIRSGSVIRMGGKTPETGKTSQSFVFADNFMKTVKNSKTIYIKAEARLTEELKKRTGLTFVSNPDEWAIGTVFVFDCNEFETIAELIEEQLKITHEAGEKLCVILDSLDGLILKNDLETKGISGNMMVAGVPKLTKLLFRRIGLAITHYDCLFIFTSQYSVDIKLDPYAPNVPRQVDGGGGSAASHQNDYTLMYWPRYGGDLILEDQDMKPDIFKNKTLGVYATVEIKKSATDVTGTKVRIPIKKGRIGSAIWVEKELVDMVVGFEMLKKAGAWFTFDDKIRAEAKEAGVALKEKIHGMNGVYTYFEEDKAAYDFFFAKIQKIIS